MFVDLNGYQNRYVNEFDENQTSFLEWMQERHQTSPTVMKVICRQTAARRSWWKEYESAMEWLRRRYRYEMALKKQLLNNNPFEEDKNNG